MSRLLSTALRRADTLAIVFMATSALGCSMGGALGQAVVAERCDAADARCSSRDFAHPIAVGGVLRPAIETKLRGAAAPAMHFQAADEAVLRAENGRLEGVAPGMSAVMLVTDDGTVIDLFHVWVKAPTGIDLYAYRSADRKEPVRGTIELLPGETLRFESALHGEGQPLGGDVEQTWRVDKPVGALLEDGAYGTRRFVATSPGEATLTVEAGRVFATVKIAVRKPAAPPVSAEVSR